jgi:hypothetical protein
MPANCATNWITLSSERPTERRHGNRRIETITSTAVSGAGHDERSGAGP